MSVQTRPSNVALYDDFTGNDYAYRKNNELHDAYREFEDVLSQYRSTEPTKEEDGLAVVSIDLDSAFDTFEWPFISNTLKKMNKNQSKCSTNQSK